MWWVGSDGNKVARVMILLKSEELRQVKVIACNRWSWSLKKSVQDFNICVLAEREGRITLFKKLELYIGGSMQQILVGDFNYIIK